MNRQSSPPKLIFACELPAQDLQALFADSRVMAALETIDAGLALGILDLSPERAEVVRLLNEMGIPVVAWLLLPKEQGYWFNVGNAPEAVAGYASFKAWSAQHGLQWAGVGLDIEPDMRAIERLTASGGWRTVPGLLGHALDGGRWQRARAAYRDLVAQIRADGFPVEAYHIPMIADERRVGSTFLQRLMGLVDIPADREVFMLYSSFVPVLGAGLLWSYAPDAQAIGVGSTGGGVTVAGAADIPPLSWEAFSRDLLLARTWGKDIFIFSLEGCLRQGFLSRLSTFDWSQPVATPPEGARQVRVLRKALQAFLWGTAHPLAVLAAVIGLVWLLSRLRPPKR